MAYKDPEVAKEYYKSWRRRNKAHQREYRENNKERIQQTKKTHYAANKEQYKAYRLKSKYNISIEERLRMLNQQNGLCAICECEEAESKGRNPGIFNVDHCEASGHVRGLLCYRCNIGLGHFFNDAYFLKRALEYIERTN
jgi:hypothetical protein